MVKKWLWVSLALAVVLLVSACQSDSTEEAPESTAMNEATFVATEYAYQGPESISAGWTRLVLDNQGELGHDLILIKLAEGKTTDDVLAALAGEGPPDWAEFYGGVSAEAGQAESYLAKLTPGNYALLSFGQNEDGPPDAAQGMLANLAVTEAAAGAGDPALPEPDASVRLVDYAFDVSGDIGSGKQLLRVSNNGTETHEMIVMRLQDGTTFEDFQAAMEQQMSGETGSEPPVEEVGGTFLSPGVETYLTLDFEKPGNYVLICFFPSPNNDMQPHVALGMVQEIAVE